MKLLIRYFYNAFVQSTHNIQQNLNFCYYPIPTKLNLNKGVWIQLLLLHELPQNYTHTHNYHSLSSLVLQPKEKKPKRDAKPQNRVSGMVIVQLLASHAPHLNCTAPGKGSSISHTTGEFQVRCSMGWNYIEIIF